MTRIGEQMIRFIDSEYRELFQIPDGGSIKVTYPPEDGRGTITRPCTFLDEYHTRIGSCVYHICEFAGRMESLGARYEPAEQLKKAVIRPKTARDDRKYSVSRDAAGYVGIFTGEFGNGGDRFHGRFSTKDFESETPPGFMTELQSVVYALRKNVLKDYPSMSAYCQSHPEARLPYREGDYGFKLSTANHRYFLGCTIGGNDGGFSRRFRILIYEKEPVRSRRRSMDDQLSDAGAEAKTRAEAKTADKADKTKSKQHTK